MTTPLGEIPLKPPIPVLSPGPFQLITPFVDPVGTFRATRLTDLYRIVPNPQRIFNYDLGAPPDIRPIVFTIQNRTISNTLEVQLTLPSYLRVIIADIGPLASPPQNPLVFHVPAQGDTTTQPILVDPPILQGMNDPGSNITTEFQELARKAFAAQGIAIQNTILQPELSGEGIVNIVIAFDEDTAIQFHPGTIRDPIIFDVNPLNVTGPCYVDVNVGPPIDLNPLLDVTQSVPVDTSGTGSDEPDVVEVPVIVEKMVVVPDFQPRWIDGTTGLLTSGSPPAGWVTDADGRAYPPMGTGSGGQTGANGLTASGSASLSPLEKLVFETKNIPPTFIGSTRRGYIINANNFLTGAQPSRVSLETINMFVADTGVDSQFRIINWQKTFVNGTSVPDPTTDARTAEYFALVNNAVAQNHVAADNKTAILFPGIVAGGEALRMFVVSKGVNTMLIQNSQFSVQNTLTEDTIQLDRSIATAASIIHEILVNGSGVPIGTT